ncbi:MAG: hypothetical protein PHP43_10655 [Methanoculleus sp.]|nr:hypothetical protein [Methanoculleus sp.]
MTPNRAVLLCILVFVLAAPAAAASVERALTSSGNDLAVTLTVTGIPVGGIVETIPAGCTWVGTDHPDDRTRVSGQKIAFAVIGEEAIRYRVQGPPEAGEEIAGTWEDLQTGESGAVGSDGPRDSGEAAQTAAPGAPGFEWAAALAALAVLCARRCGR